MALVLTSCSITSTEKPVTTLTPAETEYTVSAADMLSPTLADTLATSDISEQERNSLIWMREEEKLAHDIYTALYQKWGMQIFSNIAASETTHTEAVLGLLNKYSIPDPAKSEAGAFTSPAIQTLYDTLVAQGNTSLRDALIVGATIEDLDISDLNTQMKDIDNIDIKTVYARLKSGSENHMRAFIRNLSQNGGTYTPVYISQEEYDAILSNGQGGMGRGRNN
ncbi:DUF2202 domain-containing protein [Candidatus Gracilibacteria bacterium]|nr:DUF2202 domain-containing protein [Candidatus Gracilibacteria bacterium]